MRPDSPAHPAAGECRLISGTLLQVAGLGVLLTGDSGSGKSDAALGLLDRGHQLVADDAVEIRRDGNDRLLGTAPAGFGGLLAVRGLGIVDAAAVFGAGAVRTCAALDLIIHFLPGPPPVDALSVDRDLRTIMAAQVPRLKLSAGGGRDLPLLVETAARAFALERQGRRPQAELITRQQDLVRGASCS